MTATYTHSHASTFTLTNAKYLASKVQADLMRLHRYYYGSHGAPALDQIERYYEELVLLQVYNFLDKIEYGFVDGHQWIKALQYAARQGGVLAVDDDPGGIRFSYVPPQAQFSSMLVYNHRWQTAIAEKAEFLRKSPIYRTEGKDYKGTWSHQRAYSSGGRGLVRAGI